jgi:acyl-CoA synthetase (AMP-forming)/AMP-acid ligase II
MRADASVQLTSRQEGRLTDAATSPFNLADLWEATADEIPDRVALVVAERRLTYRELDEGATRLANWMAQHGFRPGDHVALLLWNGTEYVEGFLAAHKLRGAAVNVNYRYVEEELRHVLADSDAVGAVVHRRFAPRLAAIRADLARLRWVLLVDDDSGVDPGGLGAEPYEEALASSSPERSFGPRSGDDPYLLYTGGTTGLPKGVLWRSEDAFFACIGGGDPTRMEGEVSTPEELKERILDPGVFLPVAPLMHAAGNWTLMMWLYAGWTIVLVPGPLNPKALWEAVERERVNSVAVVGDAVLRPLLDAWDEAGGYDRSSLFLIGSGGAPLSPSLRERFFRTLPGVILADGYGSSETGIQAASRFSGETGAGGSRFTPADAVVLDEETLQPVAPGSGVVGRVARTGRIPVGYYKDEAKTKATFFERDGRRWALTGDSATVDEDGSITLLGRGSLCINTGGEKVYPEEVEGVLRAHPDVYDVLVVGTPDERWGSRVVALVQPVAGGAPDPDDLTTHCRSHLAGYKVPKEVRFVDEVVRSPTGKPDYRWAAATAAS